MPRAYLDHASCVPLRPEGRAALIDALDRFGSDPGRLHSEGMASRAALEHARDQVASLVGARSREVVFTSGATEAIAAACWGAARAHDGPQVISPVEHSAVRLGAARHGEVVELGVDRVGRIDLEELDRALDLATGPGARAVGQPRGRHPPARRRGRRAVPGRGRCSSTSMPHRASGATPSPSTTSGPTCSRSAGPSSAPRWAPAPCWCVGAFDSSRCWSAATRSGPDAPAWRTCPAWSVSGRSPRCSQTRRLVHDEAALDAARIERLASALTGPDGIAGVTRLGDPVDRVPHLLCLAVADVEPQAVLLGLDQRGVAAHSGSSCSTESLEPSPVLEAMGVDAQRSLRLSVGWSTVDEDLDLAVAALGRVVDDLRLLRG